MYRLVGTDLYIQTHVYMLVCSDTNAIAKLPIRRPSKKGRFHYSTYVKTRLFWPTCVGELFAGVCTHLHPFMYKHCFQCSTQYRKPFSMDSTTEIDTEARRCRFVCTGSCVQVRTYTFVCAGSLAQICVQACAYRFVYKLVRTDLYVQTRVYRLVGSNLYVQTRRYRFVCTCSCVHART